MPSEPCTVDRLRKLLRNELDVVDESRGRALYVNFYADEGAMSSRWQPVISLRVEGDFGLTVASSSCIPVRNWSAYADAYARAVCFLRRSGMSESWRDG